MSPSVRIAAQQLLLLLPLLFTVVSVLFCPSKKKTGLLYLHIVCVRVCVCVCVSVPHFNF